jgi:hypothetical protein
MLTYFNTVLSGEAEPFWPHVILLSVSIFAAFTVGFGIILESPKYSSAVHRIATWLVLGGIAVESLCTVFLFVFDESISSKQQSTIESQNAQIILFKTRLASRSLSKEQFDKIQALKGKISAVNIAWQNDPECMNVALLISGALLEAGIATHGYPLSQYRDDAGVVIYDPHAFINSDGAAPTRGEPLYSVLKGAGIYNGLMGTLPNGVSEVPIETPTIFVMERPSAPYLSKPYNADPQAP